MTTDTNKFVVSGITVDVVRKAIKNLHLGVYPPNGRVRVAAPVSMNDDAIRLAVVSRLSWIKRQRKNFLSQPRQSARKYVSGESHYYLGRCYRLSVSEGGRATKTGIVNGGKISMTIRPGASSEDRERAFLNWCRRELKSLAAPLIDKWAKKMALPTPQWGVKRMKTKWGSCNAEAGRIWLNLELIKKPVSCLEYIIVHELAHFQERHHDDRFIAVMDNLMPDWRLRRDELSAAPLGHDDWE